MKFTIGNKVFKDNFNIVHLITNADYESDGREIYAIYQLDNDDCWIEEYRLTLAENMEQFPIDKNLYQELLNKRDKAYSSSYFISVEIDKLISKMGKEILYEILAEHDEKIKILNEKYQIAKFDYTSSCQQIKEMRNSIKKD